MQYANNEKSCCKQRKCSLNQIFNFRLTEADIDAMESLVKENHQLKQQLQNCFSKVAKTQKVSQILLIHWFK